MEVTTMNRELFGSRNHAIIPKALNHHASHNNVKESDFGIIICNNFLQHFANESKWPYIGAKNTTDGGDQNMIND